MNPEATDSCRHRTEPGQLPEANASDLSNTAPCQDVFAPTGADLPPDITRPAQTQKSLEEQLQELRAEITWQSFADRQLRARAGQRAADARAEAFDALSRASEMEARLRQSEQERDQALARAAEANARYAQAEQEKTNAYAQAERDKASLYAQAERDKASLYAQAERDKANAYTQWAALQAQNARERDEAQQRILQLESSLRYTIVLLNSTHKATFLGGIGQHFRQWRQARLIRKSPLFESGWYVLRYPEVVVNSFDPAYDYLWNANLLDRDPGPNFDTSWYLQQYSDVARGGMNPLLHYILFGAAEGRQIHRVEELVEPH